MKRLHAHVSVDDLAVSARFYGSRLAAPPTVAQPGGVKWMQAGGEACPVRPGQPMTAHRGIDDPAAVDGPGLQREAAFVAAFRLLGTRITVFTGLPLAGIGTMALGTKRRKIGHMDGATTARPKAG